MPQITLRFNINPDGSVQEIVEDFIQNKHIEYLEDHDWI
jgi:hypothetical protein